MATCWNVLALPCVRSVRLPIPLLALAPPLAMLAMSRPAQKLRPSPDNTTARTPFMLASSSPAAMIP
jgi:hypothetical protein